MFDRIEILSPKHPHTVIATLCAHFDAPVPGSDGRGVCYITTNAPIRAYTEDDTHVR